MKIALSRPLLGAAERSAVDRVIASGQIAGGAEVEAFEVEFATLVDGRHCVAVSSGTSALHLGMLAAGIGIGDEVIVPSFTFAASANAIKLCGATPVFVEIDPVTFCLDVDAVADAITAATAAIMPVHLFGHPANMRPLADIADRRGLLIVEDAAQAHGAQLDGTSVGGFGSVGAFSFYPTKNMTTGEGGMIVTGDEEVVRMARLLRNQGMKKRYHNEVVGFNARMTDVAAAIGRVQLSKLHKWTESRRANAMFFNANLASVRTPQVTSGATHVYHQYTIRAPQRDHLRNELAARGIESGVYYPVPVHRLPAFNIDLELQETELATREVLSIPVRPDLTEVELERIVEAVNQATS